MSGKIEARASTVGLQSTLIHAGGGSFKELRLTLFIATHMEAFGHCQQPQARFGAREPR